MLNLQIHLFEEWLSLKAMLVCVLQKVDVCLGNSGHWAQFAFIISWSSPPAPAVPGERCGLALAFHGVFSDVLLQSLLRLMTLSVVNGGYRGVVNRTFCMTGQFF